MSQALYVLDITKISTADQSTTGQYLIQKMDGTTAEKVVVAAAATDKLLGVLQNKPKAGEPALVRVLGTSKVVAGGAVAQGDFVTSDGAGKAIATTTDKNVVIGMALEAAATSDIFEILMVHFTLSI